MTNSLTGHAEPCQARDMTTTPQTPATVAVNCGSSRNQRTAWYVTVDGAIDTHGVSAATAEAIANGLAIAHGLPTYERWAPTGAYRVNVR